MAFIKQQKPARTGGSAAPMITIGRSGAGKTTYLALNTAARKALGDPVAVYLEWDADAFLLRLVASSPEDPAAYTITKGTGRLSVTAIMRELGLIPRDRYTAPGRPHGWQALVVDVSEMRTISPAQAALEAVA